MAKEKFSLTKNLESLWQKVTSFTGNIKNSIGKILGNKNVITYKDRIKHLHNPSEIYTQIYPEGNIEGKLQTDIHIKSITPLIEVFGIQEIIFTEKNDYMEYAELTFIFDNQNAISTTTNGDISINLYPQEQDLYREKQNRIKKAYKLLITVGIKPKKEGYINTKRPNQRGVDKEKFIL